MVHASYLEGFDGCNYECMVSDKMAAVGVLVLVLADTAEMDHQVLVCTGPLALATHPAWLL